MEKQPAPGLSPAWGFIAVGFYVTHAITLIRAGEAPHLLWSCHLSCLVLAAGIWMRNPVLTGVAMLWAAVGLPAWIASVLSREGFSHPTSTLTHVVGLGLAVVAVRTSGMPRGAWWRALFGLAGLWLVTRFVAPPLSNVNVTRTFWFGGEGEWLSFPVYLGILASLAAIVFAGIEKLVRAVGWRSA